MYISSGVMGFHWEFTDMKNHMFFLFNASSATILYGSQVANVQKVKGILAWPNATAYLNTWISVALTSLNGTHSVWLSTTNLNVTWNDTSFTTGSIGFLSNGVGYYDNLIVNTTCDYFGQLCTSFTSGMSCNFGCDTGYSIISGIRDRKCTFGNWSGSPLVCQVSKCHVHY